MLVDMFSYNDIPYILRQNIVPCMINYIESGYFLLSPYVLDRLQKYMQLQMLIENISDINMAKRQELINKIEDLRYIDIMDRATVYQFEKMIKYIGFCLINKNITSADSAYHTIADEIFRYFERNKYQNIPPYTIYQMQQIPYYSQGYCNYQ